MGSDVRMPSAKDWGTTNETAAHVVGFVLVHGILPKAMSDTFKEWGDAVDMDADGAQDGAADAGEFRQYIRSKAGRAKLVLTDANKRRELAVVLNSSLLYIVSVTLAPSEPQSSKVINKILTNHPNRRRLQVFNIAAGGPAETTSGGAGAAVAHAAGFGRRAARCHDVIHRMYRRRRHHRRRQTKGRPSCKKSSVASSS